MSELIYKRFDGQCCLAKKLRHRKITTELHVLLLGEFQTQLTMRVLLFVSVRIHNRPNRPLAANLKSSYSFVTQVLQQRKTRRVTGRRSFLLKISRVLLYTTNKQIHMLTLRISRSPSNGASISHTSPWSQPFPE